MGIEMYHFKGHELVFSVSSDIISVINTENIAYTMLYSEKYSAKSNVSGFQKLLFC